MRTRESLTRVLLPFSFSFWLGCTPPPKPQLVVRETTLEGNSGIALPGERFLHLKTVERDEIQLPPEGVSEEILLRYLGVTAAGTEDKRPREVLGHRKLAASVQVLLEEPMTGGSLPLLPDLFRYDYTASQGLLRNAREQLFLGATSDAAGRMIALPLASAGSKSAGEDWALLYAENGALTNLPRPGDQAVSLSPPLFAASNLKPSTDRRVWVRLSPDGRFAASVTKAGKLEISALDGTALTLAPSEAWECAWHPTLPLLYVTSPRGLEGLSLRDSSIRLLLAKLPGGEKLLHLEISPCGKALLAAPTGGGNLLWRFALDSAGEPVAPPLRMPMEAAQAPERVWEPGGEPILLCFYPNQGESWRVAAASGKVLSRWQWDARAVELHAAQTGPALPTVVLRYSRPGFPAWQKFTAWYDWTQERFRGVSEKPPIEAIVWIPRKKP